MVFSYLETLDDFESWSHKKLGASDDHAASTLDSATIAVRIAFLDDELAFRVVGNDVVLLRVLLGHDLLALEVPVAFGIAILDLALDLGRQALVAFHLLRQSFRELERRLFHVQIARGLLGLVDHARVLALVLFHVLRDAQRASTAQLLLRDLVAFVVRLDRLAVLEPLRLAVVVIDEALEHGVLGAEHLHLSWQFLQELVLWLCR